MQYHEIKIQALAVIRKIIQAGESSEEDISLHIQQTYGLSEKFVKRYIESLKNKNYIEDLGGHLKWKATET